MKNRNLLFLTTVFLMITSCSKEDTTLNDNNTNPTFANGLSFEKLKDLGDNLFEDQMGGFLANPSNNSLYVSCRDKFTIQTHTQTIYKLDLNNLNLLTKTTILSDFVTKRNHIYKDTLYVFSGSGYTKFDLDLNKNISWNKYNPDKIFSRFGSAILNENVYIVGGFFGFEDADEPNYDKKIWKNNLNTNLLEFEAYMPKNRNGGSSEILNNKIYTFFGYEKIDDPNTTSPAIQLLNDIQIYDINTKNFESISLPSQVKASFTAKYKNYIFVAGNKTDGNFSSPVNGGFFGYFDTRTNTMTEIPITVSNNTFSYAYISEIEIMNNKIYAIVRDANNNFSIQVANLQ